MSRPKNRPTRADILLGLEQGGELYVPWGIASRGRPRFRALHGYSERVHASTFRAMLKAEEIEPNPGKQKPYSPVYFRLVKRKK